MFDSFELIKAKRDLDELFEMVPPTSSDYDQISAHWAKYITVRVSGFMEEVLETVLVEYARKVASGKIINYAQKQIEKSRNNPNTEKIAQTLYSFSKEWGASFEEFAGQEGRKDALNSVMSIRHNIAHGRNSGVTIGRIKGYYDKCLEIAYYLEELVNA